MNRILLPLVVLFLVCACTYEPQEIYQKEIPVPENLTVKISLSAYDSATTIPVFGPTYFQYDYSSEFGSFEKLEVFVDENLVYTSTSATGSIPFINDALLVTGQSTLKLQTTAKTNTGSLADKLDAEKYIASRSWTLDIMTDAPERPELTMSIVDGFLKLSWTKYTKSNFSEYYLTKSTPYSTKTYSIFDPDENFFIDKEFMGEQKVVYNLVTYTYYKYAVAVSPAIYDVPFSVKGEFNPADSSALLRWSKIKLYGIFQEYTVWENGQMKANISDVNDTTLLFKPADITFHSPLIYNVQALSKLGTGSMVYIGVDITVCFKKLPVVPSLYVYNTTTNSIYGFAYSTYGNVHRFNSNLELMDSFYSLHSCAIPPAGNFFFTISNNGSHLVEKNLTTLQPLDSVKLSTMAPGGVFDYPSVLEAATNHMVTFRFLAAGSSPGSMVQHVLVYDMVNHLEIYHKQTPYPLYISKDGNYLYQGSNAGSLYKIENNTTTLLNTFSLSGGYLAFDKQNDKELYTIYYEDVIVYDVELGTITRTIKPPNADYIFIALDPIRNHVLYSKPRTRVSYIVDGTTQTTASIKAAYEGTVIYRLVNGYLIDEQGFYFKAVPD